MPESVVVIFRQPPYGTVFNAEGFRVCTGLTALDVETHAVFIDDAVYTLLKGQEPEEIHMGNLSKGVGPMIEFEVRVYVVKESLEERGINEEELIENDEIKFISKTELGKLIAETDTTFTI
ncbi:MAG: DsrE family protein [Candidatus Sifarchaeia archaeon]|jgi:tRNA 2-thiouridine synthesizing protein C